MVERVVLWTWNHYRPKEGWLPLFLLGATVACLVAAILAVEWVPESGIVIPTASLGLFLGVVLAKRPLRGWIAWVFITIYGLLVTTLWLGQAWPPLSILFSSGEAVRQYWLQQGALFLDRMGSWFKAAFTGGASRETIVFAFGLGALAWFLAAYAGWSTYRQRRPLPGLTLMGVALAVNGYYGQAPIWLAALFVGLAALLTAVMHYANLEQEWQANRVDYSAEIRFDLILYAGGVAALLLALAFLLPAFSVTKLSQALLRQPSVNQAEETLGRVFAGVQQPYRDVATGSDDPGLPGSPGGRGVMPRSFLLGNAPQLQETVVMQAAVRPLAVDGREITMTTAIPLPSHWRGLAYDVYTGRGWALTEERQEVMAADELIPLSPAAGQTTFSQSVQWVYDQRVIRYTVGLPLRFDHGTTIFWRGLEDFSRAQGRESIYQATTRFTTASAADLRQTAVADIPPAILARYTALPDTLPERIGDLAQEVAGSRPTAYDQALALERFLRQYPYSLEVNLPEGNIDPVDYFLFELQEGFCDYYASAMAVMARSLGLPARLAVGFLAQAPDENGIQTIYQINAHSWVEVYFAGYGWVEFEPTAAFPTHHDEAFAPFNATEPRITFEPGSPQTPPIPERQRQIWRRLWPVGLIGLLVLGWWWRQRRQVPAREPDAVLWAYGRLQQSAQMLGQSILPGYTPNEFASDFLARLNTFAVQPSLIQFRLARLVNHTRPHIERLISLFIKRQYAQRLSTTEEARIEETARQSWRNLRRPLWLLRLIHWLTSLRHR